MVSLFIAVMASIAGFILEYSLILLIILKSESVPACIFCFASQWF